MLSRRNLFAGMAIAPLAGALAGCGKLSKKGSASAEQTPARRDFAPPLRLSSGCAAGPTEDAAALRAMLELIERDAAALWWRGGRRGRAIASDSDTGRAAETLLRQLRPGRQDRHGWLLRGTAPDFSPCWGWLACFLQSAPSASPPRIGGVGSPRFVC